MHVVKVWALGTGSGGNAWLVEAESTRVLVDAGLSPRKVDERLQALGAPGIAAGVHAVIATHEHGDHFGYARQLARALGCPLYLHDGIVAPKVRARCNVLPMPIGQDVNVRGISVLAHGAPHDAPQIALRLSAGSGSVAIATDLGHVPPALVTFLAMADLLFLEANFCPELLAMSPYPAHLRGRIAGPLGHLSNHQTASALAQMTHGAVSEVVLCHLSKVNNDAARALTRARLARPDLSIVALEHGEPGAFAVQKRRPRPLTQLVLPLA